jgi:hypothetical protein
VGQLSGRKTNTTDRGLGWKHQQHRASLLRKHIDGTPCWWCGLPMFKANPLNWDGLELAADHSQPRALGGTRADRLLHGRCNSQRRDGKLDHVRPATLGVHPSQWTTSLAGLGITATAPTAPADTLQMDW